MPQTEELLETLGGTTVFKRRLQSPEDLRIAINRGIPFQALIAMTTRFGLDLTRMGRILHVPSRTMARRKLRHRFSAQESDRIVRVARIVSYATEVFGTHGKASTWLTRPNRALRQAAPLDLLDTDVGTREVETILGRIEHGVIG